MTLASTKQFGQSKVRDLGIEALINQYIARLDVSVDHLWLDRLMQISKPVIQ